MKRIYTMLFVLCAIGMSAQFSEDFEAGVPMGWTMDGEFNLVSDAGAFSSQYFNVPEHTQFIGINDDGLGNSTDPHVGTLTSGAIDLTNFDAGTELVLSLASFFLNGDYQGADETAKIYVSTDMGTTWDEFWNIEDAGNWITIGRLFPYAGETVWLRFEYQDGNQWNFGWAFDDVSIAEVPEKDVILTSWNKASFFTGGFEGGSVSPGAYIQNNGSTVITSVDLTWSDGVDGTTETFSGLNIAYGESALLDFTDSYIIPAADVMLSLSVGNMNGEGDDENPDNDVAADLGITVITPNADRGVLVEEATGTWCPWCPRGTVFMDGLTKRYPGKFVGIAVHNGDPMVVPEYDGAYNPQDPNDDIAFALLIGGYPSSVVERGAEVDPSDLEAPFVTAVQTAPPARLTVGADWNDATRELTLSVSSEFMQSASGYKLGAILYEDGVTGTGSGYNQANNYANGAVGPMGGFELYSGAIPANEIEYDHVARALIGDFDGEAETLPASVASGAIEGHVFETYVVPSSVDVDKMHIAGILFNASNTPVNSVSTNLSDAIANGIFVATEDVFNHDAVNVYPNPFTDNTNVILDMETTENVVVEVVNTMGQTVSRIEYGQLSGKQNLTVDGANLESGVYFIHVTMGDKLATKRVTLTK